MRRVFCISIFVAVLSSACSIALSWMISYYIERSSAVIQADRVIGKRSENPIGVMCFSSSGYRREHLIRALPKDIEPDSFPTTRAGLEMSPEPRAAYQLRELAESRGTYWSTFREAGRSEWWGASTGHVYCEYFGWPLLSMKVCWNDSGWPHGYVVHQGIRIEDTSPVPVEEWFMVMGRRALPLGPVWLGQIGNTLFYSVVMMCVYCMMVLTTRRIRRSQSKCASCGYQLQSSSSPCPECGLGYVDK